MRYTYLFFLVFTTGLMMISCGRDEPVGADEITRVQDGNGKVFLENGLLVDANLDYTQAELEEALKSYEWEREYSFYYDNHTISSKTEIGGMPVAIHGNGTIEFDFDIEDARVRTYTVSGKKITAIMQAPVWSSASYPPVTLIVVSLDMTDDSARIVMDRKIDMELDGYSSSSLYVRMVWRAKKADS